MCFLLSFPFTGVPVRLGPIVLGAVLIPHSCSLLSLYFSFLVVYNIIRLARSNWLGRDCKLEEPRSTFVRSGFFSRNSPCFQEIPNGPSHLDTGTANAITGGCKSVN